MPDGGAREWPGGMPHNHAPLEWGHYGEADWGLSAWCTCGVLVDTGLLLAVSLVPFTLTPQCKLVWGSCKDPSLHSGACALLRYHTAWYCTPHGLPCTDYK